MRGQGLYDLVEAALVYLLRRQVSGRVTTLRDLGKRVSLSPFRIIDIGEELGITFALVTHEEVSGGARRRSQRNTEVLVRQIPENYGKRIGIPHGKVEASFLEAFEGREPQPDKEVVKALAQEVTVQGGIDPYAPYRITREQYEVLKNHLITYDELQQLAREQGFSVAAIRRATGGDRMRYALPSRFWRPYVLGKKRFYLKEILDHLDESDRTYKSQGRLTTVRRNRVGDPDENKFITFRSEKKRRKSERDAQRKRVPV